MALIFPIYTEKMIQNPVSLPPISSILTLLNEKPPTPTISTTSTPSSSFTKHDVQQMSHQQMQQQPQLSLQQQPLQHSHLPHSHQQQQQQQQFLSRTGYSGNNSTTSNFPIMIPSDSSNDHGLNYITEQQRYKLEHHQIDQHSIPFYSHNKPNSNNNLDHIPQQNFSNLGYAGTATATTSSISSSNGLSSLEQAHQLLRISHDNGSNRTTPSIATSSPPILFENEQLSIPSISTIPQLSHHQLIPNPSQPIQSQQQLQQSQQLPQQSSEVSQLHKDTKNPRKYKCKTCEKLFTTSGHLARHSRIHTGERKHICPFPSCDARFARHDNCMQHYRTHKNPKVRKRRSGGK